MTNLHKFVPADHTAEFVRERHDAFQAFIRALDAPVPLDVIAVMRLERHLRYTAFGFRFLPQSLSQLTTQAVRTPVTHEGAR